jgi:hypothetical protein
MLTLCGTHAQRCLILLGTQLKGGLSRLNKFGTKVTSWFRGLADDPDMVEIGFVLATLSSFGFLVFVITKLEGEDARQDQQCWRPRARPLEHSIHQGLRELRYWIACQESTFARIGSLQEWLRRQDLSSWLPKVSRLCSLGRLQEFQESAWINSDI